MNPVIRLLGRQSLFFLALGVICACVYPLTPDGLHWVSLAAASLAWFWGVLLGIENVLARHRGELGTTTTAAYERPPPDTPFDPPPLERWGGRGRER